MTSKLQITLPKRLAAEHGIVPGDEIRFESATGVIRIVPASAQSARLGIEERLRLFDEATQRAVSRARALPLGQDSSRGRGWRREDLYDRGSSG